MEINVVKGCTLVFLANSQLQMVNLLPDSLGVLSHERGSSRVWRRFTDNQPPERQDEQVAQGEDCFHKLISSLLTVLGCFVKCGSSRVWRRFTNDQPEHSLLTAIEIRRQTRIETLDFRKWSARNGLDTVLAASLG